MGHPLSIWRRVASTELNNAIQNGIYHSIADTSDEAGDQLVYKLPNPDACKYCKAVYLEDDGVTPKIFKLNQLEETNIGRKANDWGPTVGAVHPWCSCQLITIPDGYDFLKKKVVGTEFEHEGTKHKKGTIIGDELFPLLGSNKENIIENAVLSYTGTTGRPVEKSMYPDNDIVCEC